MSDKLPLEAIQGMINRMEDKFDERFNRVDDRLLKLDDKIEAVSKTTDKNTIVLEEHQRRALANERHADLLEAQMKIDKQQLASALLKSEEKRDSQNKELADSVELFVKLPKFAYKIFIWLAAISAGGSAAYGIFRLALSYVTK